MKISKYWVTENQKILIDGMEQAITCYGGQTSLYKVQFPREGNDPELQQWLADYEKESRNYNVCNFIEQVGTRHYLNNVVQLHDEITGANFRQPLV